MELQGVLRAHQEALDEAVRALKQLRARYRRSHPDGADHDTWLFVLATLLSSTLLLNMKGTLHKEGKRQLHFIFNLVDHVRTKEHQKDDRIGSDFHRHFPSLVMCVRDFTLHLEVGGRPCLPPLHGAPPENVQEGASQGLQ
ncbi:unnamed protein product [Lampetra planeri]